MFLTRLKRTASAWKSSDAAHPLERRRHPQRAQRHDVAAAGYRPTHDLVRIAALLEHVAHALVAERDDRVVHGRSPATAELPVRRRDQITQAELAVNPDELGQSP